MTDPRDLTEVVTVTSLGDPRERTGEGEQAGQDGAQPPRQDENSPDLDDEQHARVIALREARSLLMNQDASAYPGLRPGVGELVILSEWILKGHADLSQVEEPDDDPE